MADLFGTARPQGDDREALSLLLLRDDLSGFDADFVECLSAWAGVWTPKQAAYFDELCDRYLGGH